MCVKRILSRCEGTARCPKGVGKQGWSGLQPGAHGDAASSGPNVLFFKNIWILEFKKRKERNLFKKNGLKKKIITHRVESIKLTGGLMGPIRWLDRAQK